MIHAIIPAVDEPNIGRTIESLLNQTHAPDTISVAVNNARTTVTHDALKPYVDQVDILDLGTVNGMKAGALNCALALIKFSNDDMVLVMDADTILVDTWIERALEEFSDPLVGGVGAVFKADEGEGWLYNCQRREWLRYEEEIDRTGRTFVLSGTAALMRVSAMNSVKDRYGFFYDESAITEDFRITVHLKECGWELRSPIECITYTETMPTIKMLFKQRRRWSLGALQTVTASGITPVTRVYWKQQILILLACICMSTFLVLTAILTPMYGFHLQWWSVALFGCFAIERAATVWSKGTTRDRVVSALIFPETLYALILQVAHMAAIVQFVRKQSGEWSHV